MWLRHSTAPSPADRQLPDGPGDCPSQPQVTGQVPTGHSKVGPDQQNHPAGPCLHQQSRTLLLYLELGSLLCGTSRLIHTLTVAALDARRPQMMTVMRQRCGHHSPSSMELGWGRTDVLPAEYVGWGCPVISPCSPESTQPQCSGSETGSNTCAASVGGPRGVRQGRLPPRCSGSAPSRPVHV